jgi:uncharacterized membrane protein YvbJ
MSEKESKSSKLHRLLKLVERIGQVGQKVGSHPRTKDILRQIWAYRLKIGLIFLVILFVGGVLGWAIGYHKTPDEAVEEFEEAVMNKDVEKLLEMVEPRDQQLSFGPREANDLITYAHEDGDFFNAHDGVMRLLKAQAAAFQSGSEHIFADKNLQGPFYLRKKSGLLGETYTIGAHSYYLVIHVDQPGAVVTLDDQKMTIQGEEKKIGPLLPKKMHLKGVKRTAYSMVQDEQEVNLIDSYYNVVDEYLHLQGQEINITSEVPGTEVLINGKKIGKQVGTDILKFGPISLNGQFKISGQKKVPWGTIKSAETVINEKQAKFDITPNPFLDTATKKQLIQTINTYAKERVEAMKQVSTKPYTTIDPQYKSKLEDDFKSKREFNSDEQYKGEAVQTVIAVHQGRVTFAQDANLLKIQVPVQFLFRERIYDQTDRKDEPLEENHEESYVWLIYDEKQKKWLITGLDTIYFSDDLFRDPSCVITKF